MLYQLNYRCSLPLKIEFNFFIWIDDRMNIFRVWLSKVLIRWNHRLLTSSHINAFLQRDSHDPISNAQWLVVECINKTAFFKKCKHSFEYQHLLLGSPWSPCMMNICDAWNCGVNHRQLIYDYNTFIIQAHWLL